MVVLTNTCLCIFVVLVLYFVMDSVRSQYCVCLDNQDLGTQEYSFAFPFFSIAVAKFRRFRTLSENLDHTPGLIGLISSLCCCFAISNGTFEWLSKNSFVHSKYSWKRLLFCSSSFSGSRSLWSQVEWSQPSSVSNQVFPTSPSFHTLRQHGE